MTKYPEEALNDIIARFVTVEYPHISQDDFHQKCDDISDSFKSLENQNLFELFYLSSIVDRYIVGGDQYFDIDEKIFNEIKSSLSASFCEKFAHIKDPSIRTKEIITEFQQQSGSSNIECNPYIDQYSLLQKNNSTYKIESPITEQCKPFMDFYRIKDKQHILEINGISSYCTLILKFPNKKKYTITTDFYTSTILLALSEGQKKYPELEDIIKENGILYRSLDNLVKYKLVIKIEEVKSGYKYYRNESFYLNPDFTYNDNKILIKTQYITINDIIKSREIEIKEAIRHAIVLFLKRKKKADFFEIAQHVGQKLSNFQISNNEIRDSINNLLHRYIGKTEEEGKLLYTYLG